MSGTFLVTANRYGAKFIGYSDKTLSKQPTNPALKPIAEMPAAAFYRDAYYIPGLLALYGRDGAKIPGCQRFFINPSITLNPYHADKYARINANRAPATVELSAYEFETDERNALWLGILMHHYGNVVADDVARFWSLRLFPNHAPILLPNQPENAEKPFARLFLDRFGVTPFAPGRPVHFRSLVVPEPAFQTQYLIYGNADAPHLEVKNTLDLTNFETRERIYLSRARHNARARTLDGEEAVEDVFARRGFAIVYPETLSLAEQIHLWDSARIIAGFTGSAFHTALFAERGRSLTTITLSAENVNGRYHLQDGIKGFDAWYMQCADTVKSEGIFSTFRLDAEKLARMLDQVGV